MRTRLAALVSLMLLALAVPASAQSVILGEYRPGRAAAGSSLSMTLSTEDKAVLDAIAASLSVMDDWDESDRLKVNLIVGQVGVSAGNGAVDAATIRMTLGTGSTGVLHVDDNSGSLTVDNGGTFVVQENGAALTALQLIDNAVSGSGYNISQMNGVNVTMGNGIAGTGVQRVTIASDSTGVIGATQSGTWTVQPGNTANTTAWLIAGGKTNNNAAPGATNLGALTVVANAAAPSWTEGNLVALSSDLAGALRIAGAVSCSNCSGTGASKVDDAAFTIATDSVAPAGFLADQTAPDSVNEGDVGLARMTLARIQLHTLWDAAGNERGANVNASNELLVALSSVPSHAVTNAGTFAVQADTEITTAATLADNTANPSLGAVAAYMMCFDGSTWDRCAAGSVTELTHDGAMTASSTVGTANMLYAKAAAPTDVTADGDAVLPWALRNGSQVMNIAAGSTLITSTSTSLNVNCTGGCSGGTQYTHDAALTIGSSSTTLAGARASAAAPTDVTADNDAVALWALRSGALAVQQTYGGVLSSTGNGASGTGVPRVTIANDSTGILAAVTSITNTVAVGGVVAHDAVSSGNPVLQGAYASAAAPSDVSADGDAVRVWALRNGAQATVLTAAGALIGGDATNGLDVDVTRVTGTVTIAGAVTNAGTFAVQESGSALTSLQLIDDPVFADDAAFTVATSKVMMAGFTVDESSTDSADEGDAVAARTTADRILYMMPAATTASAQALSGCYFVSAASNNATNCKASAANFYGIRAVNTSTTTYYLRLYNTAASPTCSSATGFIESIPIPPAAAAGGAGGIVNVTTMPINYATGLSFCYTTGSSSTDNVSAATGTFAAIYYK